MFISAAQYELAKKTYWALGRWQDAAPLAADTVKVLPDLAAAHVLLGNIRLKLRDAAGALHESDKGNRRTSPSASLPNYRVSRSRIDLRLNFRLNSPL